ncbi:hypothetical protein DH2020_018611 [Rehmannia glutinosa]|uniref:BHLH domain-containing protein n=1 Tax=Rehmannia glutinosa TaxID=99300 RepID=A0ABR0WKT6_REHGL
MDTSLLAGMVLPCLACGCLLALDGFYRELGNQQPSSSSGSLATRLFNVYKESVNYVDTGRIPGFAFKNNLPYMELKLHDLQRMASNEVQLQFYQTVVFMGCATGEIELGMSNDPQQIADQNLPPIISHINPTAFRRYRKDLARPVGADIRRKQNMFKKSVLFYRNLNMRRRSEFQVQGNRPSTTQLHHMISERRRREKLNESFQVLRSLLPSGSKKDKASVLSSTTEYLSSLKSQVAELSKRNQMLESKLNSVRRSEGSEDQIVGSNSSVDQGVNVEIAQVSSSTSEARFLDLRVTVRGENSMLDLIIRIMEFLKQQRNVSLLSVESNTRMLESNPVHGIVMRLKIEEMNLTSLVSKKQ